MPDLFISYAREDRDTARTLADALESAGLKVWWDRALTGGGDFALEIERQLNATALALVLWSPSSVQSEFVRDESSRARDAQKLLPVRIADVPLPLGFGTLHTLDLIDWDGDADDESFQALLSQVRARIAASAAGGASQPLRALDSGTIGPTQRRLRRGLLMGGGALVASGVVGWGWWRNDRAEREAAARDRLDKALKEHFAQPPQFESAQSAYADALRLDPALARAHYFLGHLYVQLMLRGSPPPAGPELLALRGDALGHFDAALQLADADPQRLDASQRLVAERQRDELSKSDETPALARDGAAAPATGAAPTPTGAPPPAEPASGAGPEPRPVPVGAARPPRAPAPAASATEQLPHVLAAAPQLVAAREQAQALFSPDRDKRLSAAASLTLNPAQAAEALSSAVARASLALRQSPDDPATREGVTATLALLGRASPGTLRTERDGVIAFLQALPATPDAALRSAAASVREALARAEGQVPVAYLQIAHERQRGVAQSLARHLREVGYQVPAIENTGETRAPARPAVRSQGASDPNLARWCQKALSEASGTAADLAQLRNARPATDTFEIWFDKALCAPGGREVPGCAAG